MTRAGWRGVLLLAVCVAGGSSWGVADDNWPEFRGPRFNGYSDAVGLPVTFSDTENVAWKTPIPGKGWASPVIWGNQIWISTATEDGKEMFAICIDKATGKVVHNIKVFENAKPAFCHSMNSYATGTPVLEDGRAYFHYGTYGTAAIDTQTGTILWTRRDINVDHFRGPGSSPAVWKNLVIINLDGFDRQVIAALDKNTGKTVWQKERSIDFGKLDGDNKKAYGTPTVITVDGKPQVISSFAVATIAYEPETGEELWVVRHGGMNAAARPFLAHGLVYLNTGYGGDKSLAVDPTGRGNVTQSHVAWRYGNAVPTRPSYVLVGDLLFMLADNGVAQCVDAKTGKSIWQQRLEGKYSASPVYADGKIYCFSEEGHAPVFAASKEFKLLAENKFPPAKEGYTFMASPAISGKALYVRSRTHLYRLEAK